MGTEYWHLFLFTNSILAINRIHIPESKKIAALRGKQVPPPPPMHLCTNSEQTPSSVFLTLSLHEWEKKPLLRNVNRVGDHGVGGALVAVLSLSFSLCRCISLLQKGSSHSPLILQCMFKPQHLESWGFQCLSLYLLQNYAQTSPRCALYHKPALSSALLGADFVGSAWCF